MKVDWDQPVQIGGNPMLKLGAGPSGLHCRTCKHIERHQQSVRWMKCAKRTPGGPATDHRSGWSACVLYEQAVGRRTDRA